MKFLLFSRFSLTLLWRSLPELGMLLGEGAAPQAQHSTFRSLWRWTALGTARHGTEQPGMAWLGTAGLDLMAGPPGVAFSSASGLEHSHLPLLREPPYLSRSPPCSEGQQQLLQGV